jgi:hypothetical protein
MRRASRTDGSTSHFLRTAISTWRTHSVTSKYAIVPIDIVPDSLGLVKRGGRQGQKVIDAGRGLGML